MPTPNPKPRNGVGGWIALIAIVLGGNAGSSYLLPPPPHNPLITTAAWVQVTRDVADLRTSMAKVEAQLGEIIRQLPQQATQKRP